MTEQLPGLDALAIPNRRTPQSRDDIVRQLREEKARMLPGDGVSIEDATARVRAERDGEE